MKIFFKIAFIATTHGTISSFMLAHIRRLSIKHDIFICCKDAHLLKKLVPKNVILNNINFKRKPDLVYDLIALFKLVKFFLNKRIDYTFSISPKAGFVGALSSFIVRIPNRIHWFTGQIWITKKGISKFFYRFLDKIIFSLSHHVLVDSSSQRKFLIVNKIISKNYSSVLHKGSVGGVNTKKFKFSKFNKNLIRSRLLISKNAFVFLYLGRIHKDKGIFELVEAFSEIQYDHNAFLVLVGPIEYENFKDLIKNNKKIIYYGSTTKPERFFSIANILCLPSHREGFGSVIIEAASCQIATLGSSIYGITDAIVANQTGFLHKVGSANNIKKKMLYLLKNKKLVKKYGQNARKRVEIDFEESLIVKKFIEFVNSRIN